MLVLEEKNLSENPAFNLFYGFLVKAKLFVKAVDNFTLSE